MLNLTAGASYINNQLIAKGYLDESEVLDFNQGSSKNNARMINTMYALLNAVDAGHKERESLTRDRDTLNSQVRKLETINETYIAEFKAVEQKMDTICKEYSALEKTNVSQMQQLKAAKHEVEKSSRSIDNLRAMFAAEMRKKDVEIEKLKTRLRGDIGSSSSSRKGTYIVSGMLTGSSSDPVGPGSIIAPLHSQGEETIEVLKSFVDSLQEQNHALWLSLDSIWASVCEILNGRSFSKTGFECFERVTGPQQFRDSSLGLDMANGNGNHINPFSSAGSIARAQATETLLEDFMQAFEQITSMLDTPDAGAVEQLRARTEELAQVRAQLETMTQNWQNALDINKEWEQYMHRFNAPLSENNNHNNAENIFDPAVGMRTPPGIAQSPSNPQSVALGRIFKH